MKDVFLSKAAWIEIFERLPPASRVGWTDIPGPNFWLCDDQGETLIFKIEPPESK